MPNFKDQSPDEIQNPRGRTIHGGIHHPRARHSRPVSHPLTLPSRGALRRELSRMGRACPLLDTGARGGFTLIEVVVAIAILGIALTVIIELFAGGLRLARTSKEYTKAVNYVNTKMEEIDSQQTLEEGSTEGEFDETFHWRVTTNKVNILSVERPWEVKPPIQLLKIRVDVLWKSGPKERSTGAETYRTMKVQDDEKKS